MPSRRGALVCSDVASLMVAAVLTALVVLSGCKTKVVPPPAPHQPVTVFLLDHGRTPSLVLPRGDGTLVRYAYGHWQWYALRRTDVLTGLGAVLWPSKGALGQGFVRPAASDESVQDSIRREVPVSVDRLFPIEVDRQSVDRLDGRLDSLCRAPQADRVVNDAYRLTFVEYPEKYWIFHNSNHVVAGWLEELGCQISGKGDSTWEVAADGAGAATRVAAPN
jgi:hypothetical protein